MRLARILPLALAFGLSSAAQPPAVRRVVIVEEETAPVRAQLLPPEPNDEPPQNPVTRVVFALIPAPPETGPLLAEPETAPSPRPVPDRETLAMPRLGLPEHDQVFRREAEATLHERIRREASERLRPHLTFPPEPRTATDGRARRPGETKVAFAEPNYVCYRPLFFEELNAERHGWDLSLLQPVVSTAAFYRDLALYPLRRLITPPCAWDSNAGHCLPGDPVPYTLRLPRAH